jgi:hypothetical protein
MSRKSFKIITVILLCGNEDVDIKYHAMFLQCRSNRTSCLHERSMTGVTECLASDLVLVTNTHHTMYEARVTFIRLLNVGHH